MFYRLGVRSVGLTWNYANLLADGVLEARGRRVYTKFGRQVVQELNTMAYYGPMCPILNERSFWELIEDCKNPIASHSNCYQLCPHPRNLTDDQIKSPYKEK